MNFFDFACWEIFHYLFFILHAGKLFMIYLILHAGKFFIIFFDFACLEIFH